MEKANTNQVLRTLDYIVALIISCSEQQKYHRQNPAKEKMFQIFHALLFCFHFIYLKFIIKNKNKSWVIEMPHHGAAKVEPIDDPQAGTSNAELEGLFVFVS